MLLLQILDFSSDERQHIACHARVGLAGKQHVMVNECVGKLRGKLGVRRLKDHLDQLGVGHVSDAHHGQQTGYRSLDQFLLVGGSLSRCGGTEYWVLPQFETPDDTLRQRSALHDSFFGHVEDADARAHVLDDDVLD